MRKVLAFLIFFSILISSDAIVRKQIISFERSGEGKVEKFYRALRRLTDFGRRYWADVRILLDTEREKIVFERAYTVNSLGQRIEVPKNAFHTLIPKQIQKAPYFYYLKEKVLNFVGLDLPSESVLSYRIESSDPEVDFVLPVAEPAFVEETVVNVIGFEKVDFEVIGARPEVERFMRKGKRGISIKLRRTGPYPPEPNQAPPLPLIVLTTEVTWKELEDALSAYFYQDPGIPQPLWKEIALEGKDMEDVAKWMRNSVRLIKLDMRRSFEKARSATQVLESKYGTAPEVVLLYREIFKRLGISSIPFLAVDSRYFSRRVPSLRQFKEVGLYFPGKEIFLFSDGTFKRYLHKKVLLLLERENPHFASYPLLSPEKNSIYLSLKLNASNIKGIARLKGNFVFVKKEAVKVAEELLNKAGIEVNIRRASLSYFHDWVELKFEGDYRTEQGIIKFEPDLNQLKLESAAFSMPRLTPILLREPFAVRIKVELEGGERIVYLPQQKTISNSAGRFRVTVERKSSGAAIEFDFRLNRSFLKPDQVEKLKELWSSISDRAFTTVICF